MCSSDLTLNPFEDPVVSFFLRKEKVFKDFVDAVADRVMQASASKRHVQPVNKRSRDVLDKEVVDVPSRKVDVKDKRKRSRHQNLVRV